MPRTLDPHSNYYDREEFEELKTDQRSEYFGIDSARLWGCYRHYITATFDNSRRNVLDWLSDRIVSGRRGDAGAVN